MQNPDKVYFIDTEVAPPKQHGEHRFRITRKSVKQAG